MGWSETKIGVCYGNFEIRTRILILYFIKDLLGTKVKKVVDGYPYTEIENDTLVVL